MEIVELEKVCSNFYVPSSNAEKQKAFMHLVSTFEPWTTQLKILFPSLDQNLSAYKLASFPSTLNEQLKDVNYALTFFQQLLDFVASHKSVWSQYFVVSVCLTQLINETFLSMPLDIKVACQRYLLSYIFANHQTLPKYTMASICSVLAVMCRIGWNESEDFKLFIANMINLQVTLEPIFNQVFSSCYRKLFVCRLGRNAPTDS
jgi:hypothetical protein